MKTLIIHNNNISNIDKYTENISFTSINDVIKTLNSKEFDIIYIKDNLSLNCLDFLGIELAYHIRFTGNFKFIPIVLLSDLDGFTILKLTSKAQILLTKNTFLNQIPKNLSILDDSNYKKEFLDKIRIELPKDISGDHDISNQWAIYRWAEYLKINSDAIKRNKEKISSLLYFKYLVALNPTTDTYVGTSESEKTRAPLQARKGGLTVVKKVEKQLQKILYIDDEYAKGWEDIFKAFFEEKRKKQEFQFSTIQEIKKDTTYGEIKKHVIDYIKKDIPDLVILDMRLTKEDHIEEDEKKLSGIKLLKHIKEEINPGIQVLLLTASGKSKILNEANKYHILGYIKKEHPHDMIIKTKDTFDSLEKLIDEGFEKQYLKDIWNIQQEIIGLDIFVNDKFNEIKLEVISVFEVLNSYIKNKFIYSMFAIFKVLETLVKFHIEEKGEDRFAYWIKTNDKIPWVNENNFLVETKSGDSNNRTENKIRVLLHEKLNLKDRTIHDSINSLVKIRNNTIHPKNKISTQEIKKDDILNWFKILHTILNKIK